MTGLNLLHRLFSPQTDDPRRTDGVMVGDEREFRQKYRSTGLDDLVLTGRAARPTSSF